MTTHHILKTHPGPFRAVRDRRKRFEVRKDDRAFQCGDTVELKYTDPDASVFGGPPPGPWQGDDDLSPIKFRVGFVLRGGQYGLEAGYVAFQLEELTTAA